MDKQSITGLVIIFLILVLFWWINAPNEEQQKKWQQHHDSLKRVELAYQDSVVKAQEASAAQSAVADSATLSQEKTQAADHSKIEQFR